MPTIRDVAKRSGFSVATVSRVINQKGYIHKETEKAIQQAMKELNYSPSATARSLAGKGSSTIALIVPDILNPFFPEVARAIEDTGHESGYTVVLCNSDNNPDKEKKYFEMLANKKADGVIIATYSEDTRPIADFVSKYEIPVVIIDNPVEVAGIPIIHSDNVQGGRLAALHLLERGCRKIGHLGGPAHIAASRDRREGYEEICVQQGWFRHSLIVQCGFHYEGGYEGMQALLERHPDIDGVFAANDLMAVGAIRALQQAGKRVPEDIKVIGFDGISMSLLPDLSTIAQPIYEIGRRAMETLIGLIEGAEKMPGSQQLSISLAAKHTTYATIKESES